MFSITKQWVNKKQIIQRNQQTMVEVFKTNVQKKTQSRLLLGALAAAFPSFKINFDLSDCDKVLRVEGDNIQSTPIITLIRENGFSCEILD